jgi:hypothetical protein
MLNFQQIRWRLHKQRFNGTSLDKSRSIIPRSISHFTVTGARTGNFRVAFAAGWHDEERNEECVWRWSSQKQASISIKMPIDEACRAQFAFELASLRNEYVQLYFNGSIVWAGRGHTYTSANSLEGTGAQPWTEFLRDK